MTALTLNPRFRGQAPEVGEEVRVYVKVQTNKHTYSYVNRRLRWNRVIRKVTDYYTILTPIGTAPGWMSLPTEMLQRDVNGHLRVYVQERNFPGILEADANHRKDQMTHDQSEDRIVFVFDGTAQGYRKAAMEAFKLTDAELGQSMSSPITLRAHPSQFGSFVAYILSHNLDVTSLHPRIIKAEPAIIDTSDR